MAVWSVAGLVSVLDPVKFCEVKLFWAVCHHCCVIFAASAFISEMSSRLIKNTKRRPAICKETRCVSARVRRNGSVWTQGKQVPWDDLHYWIVVKFPLVSRQHWSSINVDGSSPLIGDEKVSVILQLYDSYTQKYRISKTQGSINIFLSGPMRQYYKHGSRQRLDVRVVLVQSKNLFDSRLLNLSCYVVNKFILYHWCTVTKMTDSAKLN